MTQAEKTSTFQKAIEAQAEHEYAQGSVRRGSVSDLLADLED